MLTLEVVRGPISLERKQAIAALYGSHDPKYQDIDFLTHLFDRNPTGASFHCFALKDGEPVGHLALLPLWIQKGTQKILSAKAEAFFIRPDCHRNTIQIGASDVSLSVAVARSLYTFAHESGVEVIHMIAARSVGVIHRMAGCKEVVLTPEVLHFQREASGARATRILAYLQKPFLWAYQVAAGLVSMRFETRFANRGISVPGDRWTIANEPALSEWFSGTGSLRRAQLGKYPNAVLIAKTASGADRVVEVVEWTGSNARQGFKGVLSLFKLAKEAGAGRISIPVSTLPTDLGWLRTFLRLSGWVAKDREVRLFISAKDAFFTKPESVFLTPYFYSTF